jgi:hypothetical protein
MNIRPKKAIKNGKYFNIKKTSHSLGLNGMYKIYLKREFLLFCMISIFENNLAPTGMY